MAQVVLTRDDAAQLETLSKPIHGRVLKLLGRLERWPAVSGAQPLTGALVGRYRLRTGDYRVQFYVTGEVLMVEKIGHRDGFYEEEDMATQQTIIVEGKPYVLLPREEYDKLTTLAKAADLPELPRPDAAGNYPAVEYARASLARKIIRDRVAVGLTQRGLAKLAGIRVEHLCRIETGKHIPSIPTIDKIDRALKQVAKRAAKKGQVSEYGA